jgi:hypothetical protein
MMAFAASTTPAFPDEHQPATRREAAAQVIKLRLIYPLNKGNVGDFRACRVPRDSAPPLMRI